MCANVAVYPPESVAADAVRLEFRKESSVRHCVERFGEVQEDDIDWALGSRAEGEVVHCLEQVGGA